MIYCEKAAWIADNPATGAKYLAVFNRADQQFTVPEKAVWNSGLINRKTPEQGKGININIAGAKKLYLVVGNGGDNIEWDHANWIEPVLYNEKDTLSLTKLRWKKAVTGWGTVRVSKAVSGSDLIVHKKKYDNGIGVHSNSIIEYDLPEGYTYFKAFAGLDQAGANQNVGATVNFMVFTENPAGPMPPPAAKINIDLKELGFTGTCTITDLWSGKTVGEFTGIFAPEINRHGAGLYEIKLKK